MFGLVGYNLIKNKLIVFNVYQLIYELKYQGIDIVRQKFIKALEGKRDTFHKTILSEINEMHSIDRLITKDVKILTILHNSLKALSVSGLIRGKFKTQFDTKGMVISLEVSNLILTDEGRKVLSTFEKNNDYDFKEGIEIFLGICLNYIKELDIISVDKEVMINELRKNSSLLTGYDFIEFGVPKPTQDLVFDHHFGKLTINNYDHFKVYIQSQKPAMLERTISMFLKETINTMTEMKIVLNLIKNDDTASLKFFMNAYRIMTHLLYLVNNGFIKLDIAYGPLKALDINIKYAALTEEGRRYLESNTLVKLRNRKHMTKVIVDSLVEMVKSDRKIDKNHPLRDVIASDYLN